MHFHQSVCALFADIKKIFVIIQERKNSTIYIVMTNVRFPLCIDYSRAFSGVTAHWMYACVSYVVIGSLCWKWTVEIHRRRRRTEPYTTHHFQFVWHERWSKHQVKNHLARSEPWQRMHNLANYEEPFTKTLHFAFVLRHFVSSRWTRLPQKNRTILHVISWKPLDNDTRLSRLVEAWQLLVKMNLICGYKWCVYFLPAGRDKATKSKEDD